MRTNTGIVSFAGGIIDGSMINRLDIEQYQASASIMENWLSKAQGPMFRRPPMEFIDEVDDSDEKARAFPFQYSLDTNYMLLANNGNFRVYLNDGAVTIPTVSTTIQSGSFVTTTGWLDQSEVPGGTPPGSSLGSSGDGPFGNSGSDSTGGSSAVGGGLAYVTGQELYLESDGALVAAAEQAISVSGADDTLVHVLKFTVEVGPVNVKIGTTSLGSDILDVMNCGRGVHQLGFIPGDGNSTIYLTFWHRKHGTKVLDDVSIMSAGVYEIEIPWNGDELKFVQYNQDDDRMWLAHENHRTRVLERRGDYSWSMIYYEPDDGPFDTLNTDNTLQVEPDAGVGVVQLTATKDLFSDDDNNTLMKLTFQGQYVEEYAATEGYYTTPIKITGVATASRQFNYAISGSFTATVVLERSTGDENNYAAVSSTGTAGSYTADDSASLNNNICFYRLAIYPGNYTTGTIRLQLWHDGGSQEGIVKITNVVNATTANGEIIKPLGLFKAGGTDLWQKSLWRDGATPSVVTSGFGRLWLARNERYWASKAGNFFSMEEGTDTDLAVNSTVNSSTVDGIRWLAFLDYVIYGTRLEEGVFTSADVSDPIGPDNIHSIEQTQDGAAKASAATGDASVLFIHRSRKKLIQYAHDPRALSETTFQTVNLHRLAPNLGLPGIKSIAIQQEPERRIFCVMDNGECHICLFRREEEIVAWNVLKTTGFIEDVCVIPEEDQDRVYFIVRRLVGGSWVRYLEKFGKEIIENREDKFHLDSCLSTAIDRPDSHAYPSATTGSITITSLDDAFEAGDVNKVIWINGGLATITAYTNARSITATVTIDLDSTDIAPSGFWGIAPVISTLTGLTHLIAKTVQVWGDCSYLGEFVVDGSGEVDLGGSYSVVHAGLQASSRYKSAKLAYGQTKGTALGQKKRVHQIVMMIRDAIEGIEVGGDFTTMTDFATQLSEPVLDAPLELAEGEYLVPFPQAYSTDPRVCIRCTTPAPAEITGYVPHIQTYERT